LNAAREASLDREADLVFDLAMKGDSVAINQLFAQCIPRLRKVAARFFCNDQDSEDALQEGLLLAFRHLNQFRGKARFTTWMHVIVANAARSELRRRRSRPLTSSIDEPLSKQGDLCTADIVADPRSELDEHFDQAEQYGILKQAVQELPPMWRSVIQLYDMEGLQMKDVAAKLGLTLSTTKTYHFRASRRILEIVKSTCARHTMNLKTPERKPVAKSLAAPGQLHLSRKTFPGVTFGRGARWTRRKDGQFEAMSNGRGARAMKS
jgi:RNA polymerase sigma-70 factor, ECF subfamily